MTNEELNTLQEEAYDHLWNGRYRMALDAARKVYDDRPDDSEAAICFAWALLENGNPVKAMEYANLAVELKGDSAKAHLYRGYLLMRMSIFEGATADFDFAIHQQKESLAWAYLNKARTQAGMEKFTEAEKTLELAVIIDNGKNPKWKEAASFYRAAKEIHSGRKELTNDNIHKYFEQSNEALKHKEYWFALFISRWAQNNFKNIKKDDRSSAEFIELEAMFYLYQFRPALKKAEQMKSRFKKDEKFNSIYNSLRKFINHEDTEQQEKTLQTKATIEKEPPSRKTRVSESTGKTHALFFPNKTSEVFSAKVFDAEAESDDGGRKYCLEFNSESVKTIGVEIIFNNPFYRELSKDFDCKAVWYLNDFEISNSSFKLHVKKSWDSVIFAQTMEISNGNSFAHGQGRVDIYIENFKVCEKWFVIGEREIVQRPETPDIPKDSEPRLEKETKHEEEPDTSAQIHEADDTKSLEELLEELDAFTGLLSIKKSLRDFVNYLKFIEERKKQGLKVEENISLHTLFLGNPGTGKTTVARLLGKIFRAMGVLEKGHVIEVDRSAIVGQYIGETAQKTEKVITDAMQGVLFIDEAYTLVKKGGGQDFGQEAIDVLLKRMEDKKGEFVVVAAGYPEEMENFIASNPGLKSRFVRKFMFEDYAPDELYEIYCMQMEKEDYVINDDAKDMLNKHFISLYRKRDKSFGNARLAIQFFEDTKINLGKRFLSLEEAERTKEQMTTICVDDVKGLLSTDTAEEVSIPINEEDLEEAMQELNKLTGIDSVKKEIRDTIKLARYYSEQNEDVSDKFSSHILFMGNPGTGKTTVARIIGKIYSALGILKKGHLVETDRQGLVAGYVGQTAEKTTALIEQAMGGALFIDEAYALVKDGNGKDFGQEAIDVLIKRMEDDRGKFIVIAAGYTNEMKKFLDSNPGLRSRFTKTFTFEDYNPDQLLEITKCSLEKIELKMHDDLTKELYNHYNKIYRQRDKNFGNARIVRNIVDKAKQSLLLRKADSAGDDEKKIEDDKLLIIDDLKDILHPEQGTKTYQIKGDPERLEKCLDELNTLTGLESVKNSVEKLIGSLKVAQIRKQKGLKVIEKSIHSVFVGNPGTGKTTVARILSEIYKELGLLEKGHLVEVDRAGLVAGYQGQTAIKTDEVIKQALGGTLFIDEAYTLARGANDFGQEAVDTLLKRMEDYRGRFVVIVAGYPDEMQRFLQSNPGLQSRFENTFVFEDYQSRQLLEISAQIAVQNGYNLDEGALQQMLEIFQYMYETRDKNFGNARTAKNILYKAISNQEERISQMFEHSKDDLITIRFEDVEKMKDEIKTGKLN